MWSSARSPAPTQVAAAMFTPASLIAFATSASAPGRFSMSMTRSNGTDDLLQLGGSSLGLNSCTPHLPLLGGRPTSRHCARRSEWATSGSASEVLTARKREVMLANIVRHYRKRVEK